MKKRLPGEKTTLENRRLAFEKVPKGKRCNQIIEILEDLHEATAWEIAKEMLNRGYINILDRNSVSPRLTELSIEGIVEPIGSKKENISGKNVSVYKLTDRYLQERSFDYSQVTLQDCDNHKNYAFICDGDKQKLILKKEF